MIFHGLEKLSRKAEKERLDNIEKILSSESVDIPVSDEEINHVLLIDVLREISDKENLMKEIYRILKPDGLITIYPMHIDPKEVITLASRMSFKLKGKKIEEKILIFEKI